MRIPTKTITDVVQHKAPSTFGPFKRLLGYVWRHKKFLFPAMGCIIVMAITYSASVSSVLPVLSVMVREQGLHGALDQYVAEHRLDCEFVLYSPKRHGAVTGPKKDGAGGVQDGAALISAMKDASPLNPKRGGVPFDSFILGVNGVQGPAVTVFSQLAEAQPPFELTYRTKTDPTERTVRIREADPVRWRYTVARRVLSLIPGGLEPDQRWRTLIVVLSLLFVITLIGNVARYFAEYLTVVANCRAIIDLRRQMYSQVLKLPLGHFSRNTSDTMSRFIQDTNEIYRGLGNFFEKIVTEPFKAIGAGAVALWLDARLTIVLILATPLIFWLIRRLGKKIRRANRRLLMSYSQMMGALESTLTGMRVVKGYAQENYERQRLFGIDRQVLQYQIRMGKMEALVPPVLELLAFVAVALAILYFARGVIAESVQEKIPEFLGMIVCLAAMFDPVRKLSTVYPKIQRANAAADRVFELIDSVTEFDNDTTKPKLPELRDSIEFDRICFTYPDANRPALRDVSLTVKKGQTIALVGPNGCGKTTLVSLLPRFFSPTSGRILMDGQELSQVSLHSLRQQFSLITQESVLFPDTIRANIAYSKHWATDEEIEAAARKAFADEFIRQIPGGYDAVIGEHGATLSGGQRQRIAIARAILRDAPILIFDEATSQVDPESEQKIHQAMDAFLEHRTAFVIAHRYSTISEADRIVVMEEGRIIAAGTHDELLQSCQLYKRLYETQFGSNETPE
jgi:ATP-binding cassette, subfamily B, bacterial MsbA